MSATCSWDSSIHNCMALNRSNINGGNQLVYANVNVKLYYRKFYLYLDRLSFNLSFFNGYCFKKKVKLFF